MKLLRTGRGQLELLSAFVIAGMATFSFTASYVNGADLISGTVMVGAVFNTVALNGAFTSTILYIACLAIVVFCQKVGKGAAAATGRWAWSAGILTALTLTMPPFMPEGDQIPFTAARILPALPENGKTFWYWLFMAIRFVGFALFLGTAIRALLVMSGGGRIEGSRTLAKPLWSDVLRDRIADIVNTHVWSRIKRIRSIFEMLSVRSVALVGIVISALWLPWIVLLYPANIAADTVAQLVWARGDMPVWDPSSREDIPWASMSDHHPWMDTVIYGWFDHIGLMVGNEAIGLYALAVIQTIACAMAVSLLICFLGGRLGVDWRWCTAGVVWYAIVPVFGRLAMVIVKDSTFMPLFLVWIVLFMEYVRRIRHSEQLGVWLPSSLILDAVLCGLAKKVGLYVIVMTMVMMLILIRRRLISLICVVLMAGLSMGISAAVFPALRIAPAGKQESLAIPLQQTASLLIHHESALSTHDRAVIDRVVTCNTNEVRERFNQITSDPIKDNCFNRRVSSIDVGRFLLVWAKQGLLHPRTYVNAVPWVRDPFVMGSIYDEGFYVHWGWSDKGGLSILPQYDEGQRSITQKYGALLYYTLAKLPVLGLLMSENLYVVWIPLLCVTVTIVRRRTENLLYAIPLLISIPLLLISPTYQTRYSWVLAYGFFVFLTLPWCMQHERAQEQQRAETARS